LAWTLYSAKSIFGLSDEFREIISTILGSQVNAILTMDDLFEV
jgi:hypothetical protein